MIKSKLNSVNSSGILKEAVANVIKATAIEETALSNIHILVRDIIPKAKKNSANLEQFVSIDESVNNIIRNVAKVQRMTQIILKHMEKLIRKIENFSDNGG